MVGKKWYHDNKGNISAMRLIVLPSAYMGLLVVFLATIAFFFMYTEAILLAGVGTSLITIAMGAKTLAKGQESKDITPITEVEAI